MIFLLEFNIWNFMDMYDYIRKICKGDVLINYKVID